MSDMSSDGGLVSDFAVLSVNESLGVRQRVLLVEDNPGDADFTVERLRDELPAEFDIEVVGTLAGALQSLMDKSADAVILDLNLPDSRGLDTLARIKQAMTEVPVIVVSGLVDDIVRLRAVQAGAQEVLSKDAGGHFQLLSRTVQYMLERARVRVQHRQLQQLLDAAPDAMLVVDRHGVVCYVNQRAKTLFGRRRRELVGEPLGFSVRDGALTEIEIRGPHGARHCEMRVAPIEWHNDHCVLAVIRDVTERKRAEALQARSIELEIENHRIEEANRLKGKFLANMSHELRTPLNAIIGFADLLRDGVVTADSPKYRTFLHHIGDSGRHLLKLINDILDLAKVESGRFDFQPASVRLPRLIREVTEIVAVIAAQRQVRISVEIDSDFPVLVIDPDRLKQVLYNFLSNANKFSPPGENIVVRAKVDDHDFFRLEVEDHGCGIAPPDLPRLFVEFQQLEAGSAKRHKGTGLGLALTKRLVEAQGGSVGVDSVLGRGSIFYARLPRNASPHSIV